MLNLIRDKKRKSSILILMIFCNILLISNLNTSNITNLEKNTKSGFYSLNLPENELITDQFITSNENNVQILSKQNMKPVDNSSNLITAIENYYSILKNSAPNMSESIELSNINQIAIEDVKIGSSNDNDYKYENIFIKSSLIETKLLNKNFSLILSINRLLVLMNKSSSSYNEDYLVLYKTLQNDSIQTDYSDNLIIDSNIFLHNFNISNYQFLSFYLNNNQLYRLLKYIQDYGLNSLLILKEDTKSKESMLQTLNQLQMNSIPFQGLNIYGDPNTRLALIDRGIDSSHPAFNGTDLMWKDFTTHNSSTPEDFVNHGTQVAAIAAGKPFQVVDSYGRSVVSTSISGGWGGNGWEENREYIFYVGSINVAQVGTLSYSFYWEKPSISGITITKITILNEKGVYLANQTVSGENTNTTLNYSISSGDLGVLRFGYIFTVNLPTTSTQHSLTAEIHLPLSVHNQSIDNVSNPNYWSKTFHGIAPNVSLAMLRCEFESDIAKALSWTAENAEKYNITTLSCSLNIPSELILQLTNALVESGVVVVSAAGNDGPGANYAGSSSNAPGSAALAISVGAIGRNNSLTSYSAQGGLNYNGEVIKPDLVAPGGEITDRYDINTPLITADSNQNEFFYENITDPENNIVSVTGVSDRYPNDYSFAIGTSFAAPIVAGVVMLLQEKLGGRSAWNYSLDDVLLIKSLLLSTATETAPNFRNSANGKYSPTLDRGGKDIQEGYGAITPLTLLSLFNSVSKNSTDTEGNKSYLLPYLINQENISREYSINSGNLSITETIVSLNESEYSISSDYKYPPSFGLIYLLKPQYSYNISLQSDSQLDNNSVLDADLYIYSFDPLQFGEPHILASSTKISCITDERINDYYVSEEQVVFIVVKGVGGLGNLTLKIIANLDINPPEYAWLLSPSTPRFYNDYLSILIDAYDKETTISRVDLVFTPKNYTENSIEDNISSTIPTNFCQVYKLTSYYNSQLTFSITTIPDGYYDTNIIVYDGNNNSKISNSVEIGIDHSPPDKVYITSPDIHDYLVGYVYFTIEVHDTFSGIAKIQLKNLESNSIISEKIYYDYNASLDNSNFDPSSGNSNTSNLSKLSNLSNVQKNIIFKATYSPPNSSIGSLTVQCYVWDLANNSASSKIYLYTLQNAQYNRIILALGIIGGCAAIMLINKGVKLFLTKINLIEIYEKLKNIPSELKRKMR